MRVLVRLDKTMIIKQGVEWLVSKTDASTSLWHIFSCETIFLNFMGLFKTNIGEWGREENGSLFSQLVRICRGKTLARLKPNTINGTSKL